jgi:tRNA threonylcarbamoyladenosine biosynthesis protein TsaB
MKILALEFSSERRSVAVCVDGPVLGQAEETGGRTANSFALVEKSLAQAGLEREQIECIAVGLGPGSYAGIRSAIALAQGWQVARSVHLIGIGSVECLAMRVLANGRVNFLIDAQRNEFYFAAYEMNPKSWRLLEPLCLLNLNEVRRRSAEGTTVIPPELLPIFPGGRVLLPDAAALGMLASQRRDFVSGDKLEPIYLRETAFVKAPPPRVIPSL